MKLVTLAALLLLPSVALAGEMTTALSFAGQWSASTMGYARTLFPALLLVAFVVEIVFRDPATPPSFRQSLWRGAIVFALLTPPPASNRTLYGELCGVLAGVSDSMASTLSPTDPWQEFASVAERWQRDLDEAKKGHQAEGLVAQIGGNLFTNVLALALLLGQGAMFVMKTLASVLVILLYALGPLALVFWLPLKSDSLGRWLRTFVTVLTWPVMSAVILAIITRASLQQRVREVRHHQGVESRARRHRQHPERRPDGARRHHHHRLGDCPVRHHLAARSHRRCPRPRDGLEARGCCVRSALGHHARARG